MKTTKNSFERLGIKTGLVTSLLLVCYFSLMKLLGLAHIVELRFFNFVIMAAGILFAFKHFKKPGHNIAYLPGLGLGLITAAATVFPFAAFMYVYFSYVDPGLLETIRNGNVIMGYYITPFAATGAIVMEGLASGAILSFLLMQYFKSGWRVSKLIKRRKESWNESYL